MIQLDNNSRSQKTSLVLVTLFQIREWHWIKIQKFIIRTNTETMTSLYYRIYYHNIAYLSTAVLVNVAIAEDQFSSITKMGYYYYQKIYKNLNKFIELFFIK